MPVAAVVYAALLASGDIGAALAVLAGVRPGVVVAALAAQLATTLSLAQVYRSSLRAVGGDMSFAGALETSMSAFTVIQVLPGGGAFGIVVAARRMIHLGANRAAAVAAAVLTGLLAMLTLAVLVSLGLLGAVLDAQLPGSVLLAAVLTVAVLGLLVGLLLWSLRSVAFGHRLIDLLEGALARWSVDLTLWRASLGEVAAHRPTLGRLARIVGWSALNWSTDAAALWLVLAGLGEPLAAGTLVVAFGVEHLAVTVPLSPGGLGLVEAGMSAALVALGVPAATAVAGILAYRILSYWLPLLAGIPQYLRGPRLADARRELADIVPGEPAA